MSNSCPLPDATQRQYLDLQAEAERVMMERAVAAVNDAHQTVVAGLRTLDPTEEPPPRDYFVATLHQKLFCLLCKADPDTFRGGDAKVAIAIIRNGQNIAKHYWGAEIEPYPPTHRT